MTSPLQAKPASVGYSQRERVPSRSFFGRAVQAAGWRPHSRVTSRKFMSSSTRPYGVQVLPKSGHCCREYPEIWRVRRTIVRCNSEISACAALIEVHIGGSPTHPPDLVTLSMEFE